MTPLELKAIKIAERPVPSWTTQGYDGQTHILEVARALAPALFILAAAAVLMLFIL
jgi:hypothetical protein